jgi:hypothetical protein
MKIENEKTTLKSAYGIILKNRNGESNGKYKIIAVEEDGTRHLVKAKSSFYAHLALRGRVSKDFIQEYDEDGNEIKTDDLETYYKWNNHWRKGHYTNAYEHRFFTTHARQDLCLKERGYGPERIYNNVEIQIIESEDDIK